MQARKARELSEKYGNKPCKHPKLEKEYYLGADTGDYVCTTCGKAFDPSEYKERLANQRTKK